GQSIPIETSPFRLDGKSHALRNATLIGGGAGAGAVLGGVAAGKKGAVFGSAIGAGAGTATAYLTGKQEIVVPAEAGLEFATVGNSHGSPGAPAQWTNTIFPRQNERSGEGGWIFSERDRQTIRSYFRGRYSNLPPGLAKRGGDLPPGLEKH